MRKELLAFDRNVALTQVLTLDAFIEQFWVGQQVFTAILGGFGALALILAAPRHGDPGGERAAGATGGEHRPDPGPALGVAPRPKDLRLRRSSSAQPRLSEARLKNSAFG